MKSVRLYDDLAAWWPLFSAPEDYAEEAAWIIDAFTAALGKTPESILELGSGGGNTASHLSKHARMTLVDLSQGMVDVSRRLNPRADHVRADMRSVRLGKSFEAVLIHDAIMYMTTREDLDAALATARAHLETGGALVVLPDHLADTIEAGVHCGGHDSSDGNGRGVRYIEWTHAPAAGATTFEVDYAILLREADGSVGVHHDRHTNGVFYRSEWREAFGRARFESLSIRIDPWKREVFIARAAPAD